MGVEDLIHFSIPNSGQVQPDRFTKVAESEELHLEFLGSIGPDRNMANAGK